MATTSAVVGITLVFSGCSNEQEPNIAPEISAQEPEITSEDSAYDTQANELEQAIEELEGTWRASDSEPPTYLIIADGFLLPPDNRGRYEVDVELTESVDAEIFTRFKCTSPDSSSEQFLALPLEMDSDSNMLFPLVPPLEVMEIQAQELGLTSDEARVAGGFDAAFALQVSLSDGALYTRFVFRRDEFAALEQLLQDDTLVQNLINVADAEAPGWVDGMGRTMEEHLANISSYISELLQVPDGEITADGEFWRDGNLFTEPGWGGFGGAIFDRVNDSEIHCDLIHGNS